MPLYHQTILLDASIEAVWNVISQNAEQYGTILSTRQPKLLVAQTDDVCYVYALRSSDEPEPKTRLLLAVTHNVEAVAALADTPNPMAILSEVPNDITSHDEELAQAHLNMIKRLLSAQPEAVAVKKAGDEPIESPVSGVPVISLGMIGFFFIFIGGVFSATLLLALNWWNMGYKRKAASTVASTSIAWILCIVLLTVVLSRSSIEEATRTLVATIAVLVASIGVILWQIRQQRPVYQTVVARYGKPASYRGRNVFLIASAVVLGVLMGQLWPNALYTALTTGSALLTPFAPYSTYQDETLSVQYPSHWIRTKAFDSICQNPDICRVTVQEPAGGGALLIMRTENSINFLVSLDTVADMAQSQIQRQYPDAHIDKESEVEIDGRRALRRTLSYTQKLPWGYQSIDQQLVSELVFIQDGSDLIYVGMDVPPGLLGTADSIIKTLHFTTPLDQ